MTPRIGYLFLFFNGLLLVFVGYSARRAQISDSDDYEVAGRRVKWPLVSGSYVVTFTWASTILVAGEAGYSFGWAVVWIYAIGGVGWVLMVPLWRRVKEALPNGTTYPEWVRLRFGPRTHLLTTLVTLVIHFIVIFYLLIGLGFGFSPLFGLEYETAVLVGGGIIILFTVLGGLWSSIMTDYFQYLVVWTVVALAFVFGVNSVGGVGAIYDRLAEQGAVRGYALLNPDAFYGYFLVLLFGWFFYPIVDQTIWQRMYAISAFFTWAFLPAMGVLIGVIGIAGGVEVDAASEIVAATIRAFAPGWLVVAFAFLVFNAIASTCGSMLVGTSSILTTDIYDEYIGDLTREKKLRYDQYLVAGIGIVAVTLAVLFQESILAVGIFLGAFYVVVTVPTFVSFVWTKAATGAVFASILFGFVTALSLGYAVNFDVVNQVGGIELTVWKLYMFMFFSEIAIVLGGTMLLESDPQPVTIEDVGERAERSEVAGGDD
jgi:Na+/proline symporter